MFLASCILEYSAIKFSTGNCLIKALENLFGYIKLISYIKKNYKKTCKY